MPYRKHTAEQRAEAVALGTVMGADAAAERLGYVDRRLLRRWMEAAGKSPRAAVAPSDWQSLLDLALARTTAAVASGKLAATQVATIAGIAARNVRDPEPPPAPKSDAEAWWDSMEARIHDLDPDERHDLAVWISALLSAHHEHGDRPDSECVDENFDHEAFLVQIGDPEEWLAGYRQRQHDAMVEQLAANQRSKADRELRHLDDETRALLEAADSFLRTTAA